MPGTDQPTALDADIRSPQTKIELPRTTSDTHSPKSRKNSRSPTVLKGNACQSLGWCPPVFGLVPAVSRDGRPRGVSGTATRPPRRAHTQRGVKAPPAADPGPPEPQQSCCTAWQRHIKATLQHVVAGS